MPIQRLTFIALNVSSLVESLHFYSDVLGTPIVESSHDQEKNDLWYGGDHASYSWTDGAYLHFAIYPALPPHRPVTTSAQIGFHVLEFESIHEYLVANSVEIVQPPRQEPWGLTARYLDPDRNIVSITQS